MAPIRDILHPGPQPAPQPAPRGSTQRGSRRGTRRGQVLVRRSVEHHLTDWFNE